MLVNELMKTHVVSVQQTATVADAIDLMDLYQTSSLPVLDDAGAYVGLICEEQIRQTLTTGFANRAVEASALAAAILRMRDARVKQWISCAAPQLHEKQDIAEAAETLWKSGFDRLPVCRDDGKVIGSLNFIDVMQAAFEGIL